MSISLALPLAQGALVAPLAILVLCIVAGVGTYLLLPGDQPVKFRQIGGVLITLSLIVIGLLALRNAEGGPMAATGVYFWIFSIVAIAAAFRVITHPRPVYAALYFVLTVFATGGLFVLLQADFLAAALILIYAGAILITYMFVIMLAAQASSPDGGTVSKGLAKYDITSREPVMAACAGFALMGVLLMVIFDKATTITPMPAPIENGVVAPADMQNRPTEALGDYLFRHQLINVELAGLILTLSMVGAIVIARRRIHVTLAPAWDVVEEVAPPSTPINDDPHSIPVVGTTNPSQKAYPEK
ncbi:MAG TPA: NADH-quinone oxidoreductase subunit J [Tepidisphaeraceae bacterium]|nr:NADH-quinone oxidoreductase subunit J [Tepidisphaeraceae bacterium]